MAFIDSPTEQTTAITDLILAALSLGSALYLRRYRIADPWKASLWAWAFALLSVASGLGAAAHGITLSLAAIRLLWQPINIALGLAIALFVVGAVYDLWGRRVARRLLPLMIGAGLAFFAVNQIVTGTFLVFLIYEAVAMLVALIIYIRIARSYSLPGAAFMVAGVLITVVAATFQNNHAIDLVVIWKFDHNGVFHLIQMIGVLALVAGLRAPLLAQLERRCGQSANETAALASRLPTT